MFQNPAAFLKFVKKSPCICLTATPADDATGGIERSVLKEMKFKIFENLIDGVKPDVYNPQFERVSCSSKEMLAEIIGQESRKQAVLLYCTPQEKESLKDQLTFSTYIDETIQPESLRTLDECVEGRYRVLVADTPKIALIGLDYRSYTNSILFVTTRSFTHRREMVQAANRVGRGSDKFKRVILGDAPLIDQMAASVYKKRLVQFLYSTKQESAIKSEAKKEAHGNLVNPPIVKEKKQDQPSVAKGKKRPIQMQTLDNFVKKAEPEQKRQKISETGSNKDHQQ